MKQYRRIVSYVYRYDNGKKGENTGFVRIDTREDGVRFHCRMKDLKMMDEKRLKVYFYFHRENRLQLIFVDEFLCVRGNCEYKNRIFPELSDGDFDHIGGLVFLCGQDLLYGSCWDEKEISDWMLPGKEKEQEAERIRIEEKEEAETEEELIVTTAETIVSDNEMNEKGEGSILERFPSVLFPESENVVRGVKINIEQIPLLPRSEWKLADNAFLKQAYEVYQYLFLGKMKLAEGKEIWILGVPGVYGNREKYLAGIFGFAHYIPEETGEFKTGGRGYWICQIEDVE